MAEGDRRAAFTFERTGQRGKTSDGPQVIGIKECEKLAFRRSNTAVARGAGTATRSPPEIAHAAPGKGLDDVGRRIARAIIGNNDFETGANGGHYLAQHAFQSLGNETGGVERRHD